MKELIRLGIVGPGSIAHTHNDALRYVPGSRMIAVAGRDRKKVEAFRKLNGLEYGTADIMGLDKIKELDAVIITLSNSLHAPAAIHYLNAGKDVICEKPLCLNFDEVQGIREAENKSGKRLFYAENLCFAPKYVHVKDMIDEKTVGRPFFIRCVLAHGGPYSPWFWEKESAGGGAMMDMGCHSIEVCRWLMGKKRVKSVSSHCGLFMHRDKTVMDDTVLVTMEFEDGTLAQAEASWSLKGGSSGRIECQGVGGVIHAELQGASGIRCYSEKGADSGRSSERKTTGWFNQNYDRLNQNGYVGQMMHFIDCIRTGSATSEGLDDGADVLEIMHAAYRSAARGISVALPFKPRGIKYPVDLWLEGFHSDNKVIKTPGKI